MSETTGLTAILTALGIATSTPSAQAADNDVPCLTKEQARAKYPEGMAVLARRKPLLGQHPGPVNQNQKTIRNERATQG